MVDDVHNYYLFIIKLVASSSSFSRFRTVCGVSQIVSVVLATPGTCDRVAKQCRHLQHCRESPLGYGGL